MNNPSNIRIGKVLVYIYEVRWVDSICMDGMVSELQMKVWRKVIFIQDIVQCKGILNMLEIKFFLLLGINIMCYLFICRLE